MRQPTRTRSQREQTLRKMLEAQREDVLRAVRQTFRERRTEGTIENTEVQDGAEQAEADAQTELGFGLLQIHAETLEQIDEALARLRAGHYGRCADCGADIPTSRLQALPFATRCRACEQSRETIDAASRPAPSWQGSAHLFDMGA